MMQPCPKCQNPNRPDAKFCAYCRTPLNGGEVAPAAATPAISVSCPQCGKAVNARAKFCNYCGQALTQAGPAGPVTPPPAASNAAASPPPPYAPPAYTPSKQGLSRRQKMIIIIAGVAVVAILAILVLVAVPLASQKPDGGISPTTTITPASIGVPAVVATPTGTPGPTVTPKNASAPDNRACVQPQPPDTRRYVVGSDGSLHQLALRCDVTDDELRELNRLGPESSMIRAGECLWIPDYCSELLP